MKTILLSLMAVLIISSCRREEYYSMEDYAGVRKIDSHVHIRSGDGTYEGVAAADNFILISLNVDHGDSADIREQQDFAAASARKYPGRVFFGPTFYFDTARLGSEKFSEVILEQLVEDLSDPAAIAVKIWKNIGMVVRDRSGRFIMADDPELGPVFEFLKENGIPVAGHLGEPRNCWLPLDQMTVSSDSSYFARNPQYHMYLHPDFPTYEDQINARDNLLRKHPDLVFIGCHLGSLEWNVDSLALRLDRYPNLAVDMSARICHLQYQSARDLERVRNFIIKYQDRLLYGTDVGYSGGGNPESFVRRMNETWRDDWKYFATDQEMTSSKFRGSFNGLKLPKQVIDKIYFTNAVKWYKMKI